MKITWINQEIYSLYISTLWYVLVIVVVVRSTSIQWHTVFFKSNLVRFQPWYMTYFCCIRTKNRIIILKRIDFQGLKQSLPSSGLSMVNVCCAGLTVGAVCNS